MNLLDLSFNESLLKKIRAIDRSLNKKIRFDLFLTTKNWMKNIFWNTWSCDTTKISKCNNIEFEKKLVSSQMFVHWTKHANFIWITTKKKFCEAKWWYDIRKWSHWYRFETQNQLKMIFSIQSFYNFNVCSIQNFFNSMFSQFKVFSINNSNCINNYNNKNIHDNSRNNNNNSNNNNNNNSNNINNNINNNNNNVSRF